MRDLYLCRNSNSFTVDLARNRMARVEDRAHAQTEFSRLDQTLMRGDCRNYIEAQTSMQQGGVPKDLGCAIRITS